MDTWDGSPVIASSATYRVRDMVRSEGYVSVEDLRVDPETGTYYVRLDAVVHDDSYPNRVLVKYYYGLFDLSLNRAAARLIRVIDSPQREDEGRIEFVEWALSARMLRRARKMLRIGN